MTFLVWVGVLGSLLMILALTSAYLRWLPVTTSVVCLAFGMLISPIGLGLAEVHFQQSATWIGHLTEVAVLFSLFVSGLKLRLSFHRSSWHGAYLLAGPVMILSIAGVCLVAHYLLGLPWGVALLIGAILAPTDPVLAGLVQVNHAQDFDRVRFGLSGEAGLNDGTAFPFVLLGLLLLQHGEPQWGWTLEWFMKSVLWAVPAGLLLGYTMGKGVGRLMIYLRTRHGDSTISPNDFLALALIALSYVLADEIGGYGFLAVFAAGLGLRQAEVQTSGNAETPSEHLAQPVIGHLTGAPEHATVAKADDLEEPKMAAGVMMGDMLAFGSLVERSFEVLLVTLLGVVLITHWDSRALLLGAMLFVIIRPLGVATMLPFTRIDRQQGALIGWFGIRGIGSLYYLCYALTHNVTADWAGTIVDLTLSVVALSIAVHGISIQPLLDRYERLTARREGSARP
ncbi:cation:proton antiporter [Pseudomonas sp. PLB05]|uniref:cation:proton antiporter n=1 Tax=Pseudomonas sp. PLB05 TaxID=2899078 RepID=UPI001E2D3A8B|nr:sodium:proton antiporter [Pseudomonas sp. PLB05]MCD4862953.1 sodium:proton antiporter [Pseudomonas sp. PLB05]